MQFIETNKYQTELTEELINTLPQEVQEQLLEIITSVEFVKRLVSPNRPYAKDLPRDEKGRIVVDITNPHIIEDADYFRQPALHFREHGCYSFLKPNSNPNSEFKKYWDEEMRRCYEGYVRESDGEWVTGYNYWFMNYCPMMVNKLLEGRKKAIRTESFPFFFEGIYWRFHYLWQAREGGKHAIELAKRGCGKSYCLAAIMSHNLILGESEESKRRIITVLTAYQKEYLKDDKDGTLSKFKPSINFVFSNTPFPHLLLKNSPNEMTWQMGYKDELGREKGSLNQAMAVSAKDDSEKLRGKRGWILFEEMGSFKGLLSLYDITRKSVEDGDYTFAIMYLVGCVCAGTKVWTLDGRNINIEELIKDAGIVGFTNGIAMKHENVLLDIQRGVTKEPILSDINIHQKECVNIVLSNNNSLKCSTDHPILTQKLRMNHDGSIKYYEEVFKNAGELKIGDRVIECREIPIFGNDTLFDGQVKTAKRLPNNYQTLDRDNTILLLSGLYDTDGSVCLNRKDCYVYLTQSNREILEQVQILWRKFGVVGAITKTNPRIQEERKDKNPWFTFTISGRLNIHRVSKVLNLLVSHKKAKLEEGTKYYTEHPSKKEQKYPKDIIVHKVIKVENIGVQNVYNLTAGLSHTYLANNIVTHNTAAESESDFSSAKTLLYNPEGYNILDIDNVFDKPKQGKSKFGFFFPSYINRAGCYNKDGISDVVKALVEILIARYKAKYSADPRSVLRVIAEDPITPAEAIIKVKSAYFPITSLTERLGQLDQDIHAYDDVYIGKLSLSSDGVSFVPTEDTPIRKFGVENDTPGAIEIFEMPEKDRNGKIPHTRYIIGHDPVDNDQANSSSLSSTFVLDLWTDKLVAEYTGRQASADDNFEIVRLLCIFYNAKCLYESNKKGLFAYFSKMNSTHLLEDTPEFLRDKQLIKYSSVGSNSKGVNASAAINNYANGLIKDWLLKSVVIIKNVEGEDTEMTIYNLSFLRCRALIEELIAFNPEINVDRIRALGMVMLYREQKLITFRGDVSRDMEEIPKDYLGNDSFFTDNYKFITVSGKKAVNLVQNMQFDKQSTYTIE